MRQKERSDWRERRVRHGSRRQKRRKQSTIKLFCVCVCIAVTMMKEKSWRRRRETGKGKMMMLEKVLHPKPTSLLFYKDRTNWCPPPLMSSREELEEVEWVEVSIISRSTSSPTSEVGEVEADEIPELDSLILLALCVWENWWFRDGRDSPASSDNWSSLRSRNLCSRINWTFCDLCFLSFSSKFRMNPLALFSNPSVVWRLDSAPRGTSSFRRSRQPRKWARLSSKKNMEEEDKYKNDSQRRTSLSFSFQILCHMFNVTPISLL